MKQQPKAPTPRTPKRRLVRRFTGRMRLTAIALFVVSVVGAVMMLAANQPVENTATPEPLKLVAATAPEVVPAAPPNSKRPSSRKTTQAVVPAKATTSAPTAAPAHLGAAAPATATVTTGTIKGEVVTITGCLELDNQEYRLTDTKGADAPKARTWKSGFLKKRAADVEVRDAAKTLRLATHLGQRVTLTGVVADRTMEAWSLVVAARSCN